MLKGLCGNKNIEHILIFLFVNGKCYGTQLHKTLDIPLTPIQNALNRLEEGTIISSYFEGKTRYYRFNASYPLLTELELLLKKAYTLLPADEQNKYLSSKEPATPAYKDEKLTTLHTFWSKLKSVTQLDFEAKSQFKEGLSWTGKGKGKVLVSKEKNALIFTEKGTWINRQNQEVGFSNIYRWNFNQDQGIITLEHLRQGRGNPVELIRLTPSGKQTLSSIDSHLCGGDLYFGQIYMDTHNLRLNWRVIGPKKNEEIDYVYS